MSTPDSNTRERLVLVLDVDDLDAALGLAGRLRPWFGIAKVGPELFSASGPRAVDALRDLGLSVFLDLKLHDIPTTVGRAARVIGGLGVSFLTVHTAGGVEMVRAGVDGLDAGARARGFEPPVGLGVTVLTSDPDLTAFETRVRVAIDAGCRGVVCAATDVGRVKERDARLVTVVPGIRMLGDDANDQARIGTPGEALALGADLLVIGRAVTAADDPEEAAARVHADIAGAHAGDARS